MRAFFVLHRGCGVRTNWIESYGNQTVHLLSVRACITAIVVSKLLQQSLAYKLLTYKMKVVSVQAQRTLRSSRRVSSPQFSKITNRSTLVCKFGELRGRASNFSKNKGICAETLRNAKCLVCLTCCLCTHAHFFFCQIDVGLCHSLN